MATLRETYVLSSRKLIEKSVPVNPEIYNKAGRGRIVTLPDLTTQTIRVGNCLQAGCLKGEDEEFKHGEEAHSLNHLLQEVNQFSKLWDVWNTYAGMISSFCQSSMR